MQKLKRLLSRRRPKTTHESPDLTPASVPASTPAVSSSISCLSELEKLPFEVRNEILLAVDTIEDLYNLVHASPTFHQQYRLDRAFWLWHCLQLEIGPAIIDACTVNLCNAPGFRASRTRESIMQFIEDYKLQRSNSQFGKIQLSSQEDSLTNNVSESQLQCSTATNKAEQLDDDAIVSIASFHSSIVRPLISHYFTWSCANLEGLSVPGQLSRTERRRITRALYRFQLFCNLFGQVDQEREWDARGQNYIFQSEDRLERFLIEYEPWEIEEILCINVFVECKYLDVFKEVQWDLNPDNPSFDAERRGPSTPPGAYHIELHDDPFDNWYRTGMASLGLTVLSAALKLQDQDHPRLVDLISNEIVTRVEDWILETADPGLQGERRLYRHSDRDKAQDNREEMIFNGDKDDSPALAWVTLWKERYSNLYGDFIPRPLRRWGYIMWDRERLATAGALAIIDREWKSMYDGTEWEDPRDEMLAIR